MAMPGAGLSRRHGWPIGCLIVVVVTIGFRQWVRCDPGSVGEMTGGYRESRPAWLKSMEDCPAATRRFGNHRPQNQGIGLSSP